MIRELMNKRLTIIDEIERLKVAQMAIAEGGLAEYELESEIADTKSKYLSLKDIEMLIDSKRSELASINGRLDHMAGINRNQIKVEID